MGTINDALKALAGEQEMISTSALAKKAGSTEDTLRKQLSTLKGKGYVDGNSKEGWIITQEGRDSLERQEKIPVTAKDVGADTESKLNYYGQLASVSPDIILATVELIMSGDPEDLDHVWRCMTEMDVPMAARRRWFNLWRNYLKQGIPPTLKEKVVGISEEAGGEEAEGAPVSGKDKGRDYIIADDLPVFVGAGAGDFSLKDAKDLISIRAIRSRFAGPRDGGSGQGWSIKDITDLVDKINEKRVEGAAAKLYALEQTEQGTVLKEVTPGTPLNLNPPGGAKPQPMLIIDAEGVVQEMKPGLRVGAKPGSGNPPAQKITLVRQTDKGMVKEEYPAGEVIILNNPAPGGGGIPLTPWPAFGLDGKPILDSEGKPVFVNLDPMLKMLGFQAEQRRADERQSMLSGLVKSARENLPDIAAAVKAAVEEAGKESKGTGAQANTPQGYKCGECGTIFTIPNIEFEKVACPKCRHEYTKAEVQAA